MSQESPRLESLIGYQLKHVQSLLKSRMDEVLRPLGLSTPQYACLELLERSPGASNSELARGAFVTRQAMNTLLRGLQDRDLVTRPDTVESGRARPTTLTADGQTLLAQASRLVEGIEERMVAGLDQAGRKRLGAALDTCIDALEGPADPSQKPPHRTT
ncbi:MULTISPECIES: MarR family winged helix-turn-helix transcriptional regulator [Brevibacterium]|uniref:MarR family transcriptional regulator n=1 Tax=Brevibacterium casei TaxID=33889 RepID=A0A7T4DJ11_9MICO|nr:MarR family transcriptional regulator [Brevibacterium casei]QQB15112.1 MarR family transcriptional regulator [Brevibacterium casei]